jgi:hypothetical protein
MRYAHFKKSSVRLSSFYLSGLVLFCFVSLGLHPTSTLSIPTPSAIELISSSFFRGFLNRIILRRDPGYQALTDIEQSGLRGMTRRQDYPTLNRELSETIQRLKQQAVSPDERVHELRALMNKQKDGKGLAEQLQRTEIYPRLVNSQIALDQDLHRRLNAVTSTSSSPASLWVSREALRKLLSSATFQGATLTQQKNILGNFVALIDGQSFNSLVDPRGVVARDVSLLGRPILEDGVWSQDIQIGKQVISFLSDGEGAGGEEKHLPFARERALSIAYAIAKVPLELSSRIPGVYLQNEDLPRVVVPAAIDLATQTVLIFPLAQKPEWSQFMSAVLTHEMAHLLEMSILNKLGGIKAWSEAAVTDGESSSPTGYARLALNPENPITTPGYQEDFAETMAMYFGTRGTLYEVVERIRMPHRFHILDQVLGLLNIKVELDHTAELVMPVNSPPRKE